MKIALVLAVLALAVVGCGEADDDTSHATVPGGPSAELLEKIDDADSCNDLMPDVIADLLVGATEASVKEPGSPAYEAWLDAYGVARNRLVEMDCPGV